MYALIIVIGMVSSGNAVTPVGVTSQIVGKFKTVEQCKKAAGQPVAGGTISELNLSRGIYWYCVHTGDR